MKTIKVKTDPQSQECFLDLVDFSDIVDISKVVYYELDKSPDSKGLTLCFYDKDQNKLPLKKEIKT